MPAWHGRSVGPGSAFVTCGPHAGPPAGRGKSDASDAVAAAQSVLGIEVASLLEPRADGDRNALRILLDARRMMARKRSADCLALTAITRTTELGVDVREALSDAQIRNIAAWRARSRDSRADRGAR